MLEVQRYTIMVTRQVDIMRYDAMSASDLPTTSRWMSMIFFQELVTGSVTESIYLRLVEEIFAPVEISTIAEHYWGTVNSNPS